MKDNDHVEAGSAGEQKVFSTDVTDANSRRDNFGIFQREWDEQIGEPYPLPPFGADGTGEFRATIRAYKVHDAALVDVYGESIFGTLDGALDPDSDWVLLHVVQRGKWSYERPSDGSRVTASAGQFVIRHVGQSSFEAASRAKVKALILPASHVRPLLGNSYLVGSAGSAEMRVLTAHANMVAATIGDLMPAGIQSAHSALVELLKGVLRQSIDDSEPQLASALANAAKTLADQHLTDPDLSPARLARQLNVSVRTLHRAFAADGGSMAVYIRDSRLEQARRELAVPRGGPHVSELAAYFQFADSSHFIRAFKKRYGQTPAQFARDRRHESNRSDDHVGRPG
ncbi:helix-turn-helix domain-containing protein [Nocardia sp. NPDC049707]|uniref:helix-turn-helix domain-containing protein n=1 Tax=Nocardia sp. NPDC049707 TaxID=3154735 RepID=UPI003428E27E